MSGSIESFPLEWFQVVDRALRGPIRLECESDRRARSIRARFNAFRRMLKESGAVEYDVVRALTSRIDGSAVVIEPRSTSSEADILRRALECSDSSSNS